MAHAACGFLMGGADIIPGVSGGTVALILGVYERLVTALSHFDLTFLGHLRHGRWRDGLAHVDFRFLVALASGIVLGLGGLSHVMHFLLAGYSVPTWSFLFGLILASSVLVGLMVRPWSPGAVLVCVAAVVLAYWLVGQLPAVAPEGYSYLFMCGLVAICAMILPGISGAFILVILGMYFHVTGVLRDLLHGHVTAANVATVSVFVTGCATGLLSFSKLLRWLLNRHEAWTMAALCGFMAGSLRKIWPFKTEASPAELASLGFDTSQLKELQAYRLGHNYLPSAASREFFLFLLLVLVAALLVFGLDRFGRAHQRVPPLEAHDHEPVPER